MAVATAIPVVVEYDPRKAQVHLEVQAGRKSRISHYTLEGLAQCRLGRPLTGEETAAIRDAAGVEWLE